MGDEKENDRPELDPEVVVLTTEAVLVDLGDEKDQRPEDHPLDEGDEGENAPGTAPDSAPFDQDAEE